MERNEHQEYNKRLLDQNTVIVFDTSALLGIYSFAPLLKKMCLDCLDRVSGYLWFPYTVIFEFKRNHKRLYEDSIKRIDTLWNPTHSAIDKTRKTLLLELNYLKELEYPDIDELKTSVEESLDQLKLEFMQYQTYHPELFSSNGMIKQEDSLAQFIDSIPADKIGTPLTFDHIYDYSVKVENGGKGVPSWVGDKDNKKKGIARYCDYFIIKEIIQKYRNTSKNIIFVTRDIKDFWTCERNVYIKELRESIAHKTCGSVQIYTELVQFFKRLAIELGIRVPVQQSRILDDNDKLFCQLISDELIQAVTEKLIVGLAEYVNGDSITDYNYDGLEDCQVEDWTLDTCDKELNEKGQVVYTLIYSTIMVSYTREYWTHDDETKEPIYSPYCTRTYEGQITVKVIRDVDEDGYLQDEYEYSYEIGEYMEICYQHWDED